MPIVGLAERDGLPGNKLPAIFAYRQNVEAGGLLSYSARLARFVAPLV